MSLRLWANSGVRDGYWHGNVRLVRLDTADGLRQINRYVHPDTPVELVDA